MFIEALGEVASADAVPLMSDEGVAAVPLAALPVDMPASAALVEGAALSLLELMALPVVELDALLSIAPLVRALVSLAIGLAVSPMPDWTLVVLAEFG